MVSGITVERAAPLTIVHEAASAARGSDRIHYLDNLRALAMMGGVFLHAAFAYAKPSQSFWLATDPASSVTIDASIWFVHLFRMSLFFLLSGYFGKLMVARKGTAKFLWNRTLRLVFPFALFYPFLLAAMTVVIVFAVSYVKEPKGLLGLIAAASKEPSSSGGGGRPLETMHLWFLYYLIWFSLIGAGVSACGAWLKWLRFDWLFKRPWLLGVAPLALIPGIIGAGVPMPGPESFIPTWWPFAFYGLFYAAGWQWYRRESELEKLRPYVWYLVFGSVLLFIPYYLCLPVLDLSTLIQTSDERPDWMQWLAFLLTAYLSVTLTIASLLLGKQYLSKESPWLKFVSDSSYWVYLTHLPIAIFLQVLLIPLEWSVWVKLAVTILGTFLVCLATYVVFVRYTPIGWLLNGKRTFP